MNDASVSAMLESIVSSVIAYTNTTKGLDIDKNSADVRGRIRAEVEAIVDELEDDPTCWPKVKDKYLYDVYLQMREEEGTVTHYDYHRSGLTAGLFAEESEYYKHCVRVSEYRAKNATGDKVCSQCGTTKPTHKFGKKGGSICNACRSKAYRERVAAR
jgi:formylmethanofuran dehydrogenase subunit E